MSKEPLVIIRNSKEYSEYAQKFDNIRKTEESYVQKTQKELDLRMEEYKKQQNECWKSLTSCLLIDGVIDSAEVILSYDNGIVYLEQSQRSITPENFIGHLMKNLFPDKH